jgi:hypothetical protein
MNDAVRHLLSNLRPQDRISIASYAYDYRIFLKWAQADETKAVAALDLVKYQPDGYGVGLYEAIDKALNRGFEGIAERRALVVLGDTLDEQLLFRGDTEQFTSTFRSAQRRGISIYLVVVDPVGSKWGEQFMFNLERLAQVSGGQVLHTSSMQEVSALYARISARLGTAYSLGFTPSKTDRHGQSHKIDVTIRSGNFRVSQSRLGYVTP